MFQNYLVSIAAIKYIRYFTTTTLVESWKSNRISEECLENITKWDRNFAQTFIDHHLLPDISFNGDCLIRNNISIPKRVMSLYISYTLRSQLRNLNTFLH